MKIKDLFNEKGKEKLFAIVGTVFLLIAVVCGVIFIARQYKLIKAQREFEKLAQATTVEQNTQPESTEMPAATETMPETTTEAETEGYRREAERLNKEYGIEVPEKHIDFENLHKEVSEDIYAWIYIPNTHIDYPVFQHPTDNTYYLEHNVDGSEGYPGCIYTENYNAKDFSDLHTVIYGHNMRDTTMFSDLHLYEDEEFFDNNRYVYIYTEDMVYVYKIFAAYQTDNAHQLLNYDFSKKENLIAYLEGIDGRKQEPYVIDDSVDYGEAESLLTLSTCVMKERQFHLRYIVQALRVN